MAARVLPPNSGNIPVPQLSPLQPIDNFRKGKGYAKIVTGNFEAETQPGVTETEALEAEAAMLALGVAAADPDINANGPLWFQRHVNSINQRLDALTNRVDLTSTQTHQRIVALANRVDTFAASVDASFTEINTKLDSMMTEMRMYGSYSAKAHNGSCGNGMQSPYSPVPFIDGSMPGEGVHHNLPVITNLNAIEALAPADLIAYLRGYGVVAQNDVSRMRIIDRKARLAILIGCSSYSVEAYNFH